jgi:hypothetical protein
MWIRQAGGWASGANFSTPLLTRGEESLKGRTARTTNPPSSCSTVETDGGVVWRSEQGQCLNGGLRGSCGCFSSFGVGGSASWVKQQHRPDDFAGVVLPAAALVFFESILGSSQQHHPGGSTSGRQQAKTRTRRPR